MISMKLVQICYKPLAIALPYQNCCDKCKELAIYDMNVLYIRKCLASGSQNACHFDRLLQLASCSFMA